MLFAQVKYSNITVYLNKNKIYYLSCNRKKIVILIVEAKDCFKNFITKTIVEFKYKTNYRLSLISSYFTSSK